MSVHMILQAETFMVFVNLCINIYAWRAIDVNIILRLIFGTIKNGAR